MAAAGAGEYDVVVIGGGHNGLVAGCYLARAGLDVLVVERSERLGGMALTAPLVAEAPNHLLSPRSYENVYLRASGIVEELRLADYGFRDVDAAGWAWLGDDGESLVLGRDVEWTARELSRFSRKDGRRYRELMEAAVPALGLQDRFGGVNPKRPGFGVLGAAAWTLIRKRAVRRTLAAALTSTAADAIAANFESPQARGAFAAIATILSPPLDEGGGIALLAPALLHHHGAGRPIGGMGAVIVALERCLRAHGGEARTGAGALAIETADGRASAVELEDGTVVRARRAVIAAIPPQRVPDLAGDALEAGVAERMRAAPANRTGVGALTVNVALRGRLELSAHERDDALDLRLPTLFGGSYERVLASAAEASAGRLPSAPNWTLAILSAVDPSQAPEGEDVAQLYCPAPVEPVEGWDAVRDEAADRLVETIGAAAPRLPELEIGRYVESPADLSAATGTVRGCLYHVDHVPTRMGPLRPALGAGGYRTPLPGLYLSGAGTHPGGGVSGLPGKLSAQAVLRDLRGRGTSRGRSLP